MSDNQKFVLYSVVQKTINYEQKYEKNDPPGSRKPNTGINY